jgi:hypothetical protein
MQHSQLIRKEALAVRRGRRLLSVLGTILAFTLGGAPVAAHASTAVINGSTLSYNADAGEANNVKITSASPDSYTITDTGAAAITPDAGCTTVSATEVTCSTAGVTLVAVAAADGDDTVVLTAPVNSQLIGGDGNDSLTGGPGDDVINGRDGVSDQIDCGPGTDTAAIDDLDVVNPADPPVCEQVDLPPETTIDSGPPSPTGSTSASFGFSSSETDSTFECRLDGGIWVPCSSPQAYDGLGNGPHVFAVRAVDAFGPDLSEATSSFAVEAPPPPPVATPPGPTAKVASTPARLVASFVLIAGRRVEVNRGRSVTVALNCSGNKDCAGRLVLTTANRIKFAGRRRVMRLGSTRFSIPSPLSARVKVRLSRRKYRLVKRLRRVKALVTVTDTDRAGRARVSTRVIILRAR